MKVGNVYQCCNRCVMDTTADDIHFDETGNCNYCSEFLSRFRPFSMQSMEFKKAALDNLVKRIKKVSRGKKYDCVVGVSGGVDSSWTLYKVVELGLRPLAVHMDNGWNSELAQNNIANLVKGLGIDLYTKVIDWSEYKALMQGFFDADVIDIELLYDNAMLSVNYNQASKYGLKFILSGSNQTTEGMNMPANWNWLKHDKRNIKAIARQHSGISLKSFPSIGVINFLWFTLVRRIKWVSFLDYFSYRKMDALDILEQDFGFKPYPYKHYESVFTRFYQGYILPKKFFVDKRRLHLSTLVISNQLTRDEALEILTEPPYKVETEEEDIEYFLKKMNWNSEMLEQYLNRPERSHHNYKTEKPLWDCLLNLSKRDFVSWLKVK